MDDFSSPSSVTIGELSRIVTEFEEKIRNGLDDPERFLTITEIEELWGRLIGDTNVLYTKLLQSTIQIANEKGLIRPKKGIPGQGNPSADTSQGRQDHLYSSRGTDDWQSHIDSERSGVQETAAGDNREEESGAIESAK